MIFHKQGIYATVLFIFISAQFKLAFIINFPSPPFNLWKKVILGAQIYYYIMMPSKLLAKYHESHSTQLDLGVWFIAGLKQKYKIIWLLLLLFFRKPINIYLLWLSISVLVNVFITTVIELYVDVIKSHRISAKI